MFRFLSEGENLGDKFELIRPATIFDKPTRYFVWVRMWQIPLGAWSKKFFSTVAGLFGEMVCLEDQTEAHTSYDRARMLICSSLPYVEKRKITMRMEEQDFSIMLEGEVGQDNGFLPLDCGEEASHDSLGGEEAASVGREEAEPSALEEQWA